MSSGKSSAPTAPPAGTLGRRAARMALLLALVPLAVEAAALDPSALAEYKEPFFAAIRLALTHSLPYLVVAASAGALGLVLGDGEGPPPGRVSSALVVVAFGLGALAAAWSPSVAESLAAGDARVAGRCLRLGPGGPMAGCLALDPVPIAEAGALAEAAVPARPIPGPVAVRWVGTRGREALPEGARIELVGGGAARDVTDGFASLPAGGAAVFTHTLRVGPSPTTVRLRMAGDPLPPEVFFDATRALDLEGLAIDAGGGDRAWRVAPQTGPGAPVSAAMEVAGEHVPGGHTVVVVSGEHWGIHDLRALRVAQGELQITLAGGDPDWRVRLVGDGAESAAVPLSAFTRTETGTGLRHSLPLADLDLGLLSPARVVGVALARDGPPGPQALRLAEVRVALGASLRGVGLGTLAALDPGARPAEAMFVVTEEEPRSRPVLALRLAAALLAFAGGVGLQAFGRILVGYPVQAPLALAVGPALLFALEPSIQVFAEPRLEHLPLGLAAVALGAALASMVGSRAVATAEEARRETPALEAVLGLAALGVIAVHASADPSGRPWVDHPPAARLVPALVHALASAFEAPIFALAGLHLLALRRSGGRSHGSAVLAEARTLVPPFVFWSVAYLFLRIAKATAFGYADALRRELAELSTWVHAAVLGGAQYHLFLFPSLLLLVFASPLFTPAARRPWLGLGLVLTLALRPMMDAWLYAGMPDPDLRAFALFGTRLFAWTGYGLLAFALTGLDGRGRRIATALAALAGVGAAALLVRGAWTVAAGGSFALGSVPADLARDLLPAAVFTLFVAGAKEDWPGWLRGLGRLALGVYLVHPLVLDGMEILTRASTLPPAARVALDFGVVAAVSVLVVALAARLPRLQPWLAPGGGR